MARSRASLSAQDLHRVHWSLPTLEMLQMQVLKGSFHHQTASYPEFLSLSQLSKASLLKAAAAAMLLLVSWMLAIVSADETTSISPARSPVARQPYGTILHDREMHRKKKKMVWTESWSMRWIYLHIIPRGTTDKYRSNVVYESFLSEENTLNTVNQSIYRYFQSNNFEVQFKRSAHSC